MAKNANTVTLTLAYPLSAPQAARVLAVDEREYQVGEEITVRRDYALMVIQAGFAAGVDPSDSEAVAAALAGRQDEQPAQGGEVEQVEEATTPPHRTRTTKK